MGKRTFTAADIGIPIAISVAGLLALAYLSILLQRGDIPSLILSENRLLNFTYTMQLIGLAISFMAMVLRYGFNKKKAFFTFLKFRLADTSSEESNWTFLGPVIAVAFTLGTLSYMSMP